jgi:[acyl-carrier-protein] S-malonyltransferase
VPVGMGAMAVVLGLEFDAVSMLAKEAAQGDVCDAANDNGGGQVVVSGHVAAVERAIVLAQANGAKRAMLLPVSAPFHCSLMQPAAEAMAEALGKVRIAHPVVPVVANVKAGFVTDPAEIADLLVKQVTGTVRWRESVQFMAAQGITRYIELGAGKVLNGLIKRIADGALTGAVGTPADVAAFTLS